MFIALNSFIAQKIERVILNINCSNIAKNATLDNHSSIFLGITKLITNAASGIRISR
jgi:hypothetical protein